MNFYYFLPGVDLLLKITAVRSWMLASFLGNLQERDWNNDLHKKKHRSVTQFLQGMVQKFELVAETLPSGFGFLEVPTIAGRPGGHVFLHRNHLGQFGLGSIVKCTVYSYEGKAQAKNLEEASALESTECLEQVAAAAAAAATPGDTSGTAPGNAPGSAPQNAPDIELGRFSGTVRGSVRVGNSHIHSHCCHCCHASFFEVHKWSDQRGFGFIECADLREQGHGAVFIHQKFINGFKVRFCFDECLNNMSTCHSVGD